MDKWIQLQSSNGEDNLFPKERKELLWTNSSPSSSFASQTAQFDMTDYDVGICLFGYDTSGNPWCEVYFSKNGTYICNMYNTNTSRVFRTFSASSSGVTFDGGNSAGGSNNGAAIPLAIYGIKMEVS